jgi:hypothetical protein
MKHRIVGGSKVASNFCRYKNGMFVVQQGRAGKLRSPGQDFNVKACERWRSLSEGDPKRKELQALFLSGNCETCFEVNKLASDPLKHAADNEVNRFFLAQTTSHQSF